MTRMKKSKRNPGKHHNFYFCKICKVHYASKAAFQSHQKTHGIKKSFECQLCNKSLSDVRSGIKHLKSHMKRKFRCGLCDRFFADEDALKDHICAVHLKFKPFACSFCKKPIASNFDLAVHLKEHESSLKIREKTKKAPLSRSKFNKVCKICKKSFSSYEECQQHSLEHFEELPHACEECGERFRIKNYLSKHRRSVHVPKPKNSLSKPNRSKQHSREHRLQKENRNNLKDNVSENDCTDDSTGDRDYVPSDSDSADDVDASIRHARTQKKECGKTSDGMKRVRGASKKVFICEVCGKVFQRPSFLKQHMLVHTGEKPHKCHICDKAFQGTGNLKQHILTHDSKKPFLCDLCGKSYSRVRALRMHMREHTGEPKPFMCEHCPKSFPDRRRLQKHTLRHTSGPRKRKPIQTPRPFRPRKSRKAKCDIRKDITKKDQPYSCGICNRAFSFYRNASRHYEIHLGIRKYQCNKCDKKFTQKVSLDAHLLTHQNKEKIFVCDVCQKAFQQSSYLRRHYRKEHPEFAPLANNRLHEMNNKSRHVNNKLQPIQHEPVVHSQFVTENEPCFPVQAPVAMPYINQPVDVHHGMHWPMLNLQDQF